MSTHSKRVVSVCLFRIAFESPGYFEVLSLSPVIIFLMVSMFELEHILIRKVQISSVRLLYLLAGFFAKLSKLMQPSGTGSAARFLVW